MSTSSTPSTATRGNLQGRSRLLVENFLAYGLVSVLGRAIPFLMLPVLTRLIKNPAIYGVFDLYSLVVSFSVPICILGTYDAMFRLFFDDMTEGFRKQVCSSTFLIVLAASSLIGTLIFIFSPQIAELLIGSGEQAFLIRVAAVATVFSAIQSIIAAPTRMQNKRKIFILMTLVGPISSYAVSIPLILSGYPLEGIVGGSLFAVLVSLVIFSSLNRKWFSIKARDSRLTRELLAIGLPIAPCFFVYWIFNASDRLMIRYLLDVSEVGVYGIGSRLASVSQLIYGSFAGGWQYFAFSTMNDPDQVRLISKIFHAALLLSTLSLIAASPFMQPLYSILAPGKYEGAYRVFPYLYICPLFLMLFQIVGQQFMNIKKAYFSTLALLGGALVNIAANAALIPVLGIQGAAAGTFIGYAAALLGLIFLAARTRLIELEPAFFILFFSIVLSFFAYNIQAFPYRFLASGLLFLAVLGFDRRFVLEMAGSGIDLAKSFARK